MKNKIMLIWPWSPQQQRTNELFPIGLGYIAANIDKKGFDISILDCALQNLEPNSAAFKGALLEFQPDVVGISWWSLNTPAVENTIKVIKAALPDAKICVGGPHATACGEDIIKHIDYVFYGEAEIGFERLIEAIAGHNGAPDMARLEQIKGLIYKDSRGAIIKTTQDFVKNIDMLGEIDYRAMHLQEYHDNGYYYGAKLNKVVERSAPILTTRGCPYECAFCMGPRMNGRKIRRHSIRHITDNIKLLYEEFGVKYITIVDDNFTLNTKWAESVCDAITGLNLEGLTIGTPNGIRMDRISENLVHAMKRAGWKEVMIAPESGSPRTLHEMNKRLNLNIIPEVVDMFHRVGIKVTAFFIIGYPTETLDDIALTEKFIFENSFDFVGISIFQPLPGTAIYKQLIDEGQIPKGFIPGHYQEVTFKPKFLEKEIIRDAYNRIWNSYRNRKNLPIKNRNIATIRETYVISTMI